MASRYGFIDIDASKTPDAIFQELRGRITSLQLEKVNGAARRVPTRSLA
jgi:hypothetical protein